MEFMDLLEIWRVLSLKHLLVKQEKRGLLYYDLIFPAHGNSSAQENILTCKLLWPTATGAELNGRGAAATAT